MRALSLAFCVFAVGCVTRGARRRRGAVSVLDARGLELSRWGVNFSHRTCWCACWRQSRVRKKHRRMPGMSSSVSLGVVSGGGVASLPQEGHEAGCHHVRAELLPDGVRGDWSRAVPRGLLLRGTEGDLPRPPLCRDLPGPLGASSKALHRPAKALNATAHGEQRVQGFPPPGAPDVGGLARPRWCTCRGLGCAERGL